MMKYIVASLSILFLIACNPEKESAGLLPEFFNPEFTDFQINSSIRALESIDSTTAWFAGSGGIFGYTNDAGQHWKIDSIQINGNSMEFRAIAVTDKAVFLLNVGSPAYLLKSVDEGDNWDIVYKDDHKDIFYNSMKFWDSENGIAVGDPVEGCLSVIITKDCGNSWRKLDCSELPATAEGEAGFAASNTIISIYGDQVWLATGGKKARIFHSPDKALSWDVYETPIQQGGKMTGIFSVDFFDEKQGIIFGGNWENQSDNMSNKAITHDEGKTWQLISDGENPGYRSCVQFIPNSKGKGIIAVGIPGISYSNDSGGNWQHISKQNFYTIRIVPGANVAWLAGKNKISRMEW